MTFVVHISKKGQKIETLSFDQSEVLIGRAAHCDIQLKGLRVGKKHALLVCHGTQVTLKDLSSMSGTFVNDERIIEQDWLLPTDAIRVSDYVLRVDVPSKEVAVQTPLSSEPISEVADAVVADAKASAVASNFEHWRQTLHLQVLEEMDLRRKDLHAMSEDEIRGETEAVVAEIMVRLESEMDIDDPLVLENLKKAVVNDAVGLGPLEQLLEDDSISEIMVNSPTEIFVEKGGRIVSIDFTFSSDQAVRSVIDRIITPIGRRIDESSPMVDARLKDGSRVNAIIPPLALKGPCLTIRKFSKKRLAFEDLIGFGSMNEDMAKFFEMIVTHKKNIIVSGGTGTGKTSLLNVLSNLIPKHERVITVEDAAELQLNQPDLVSLEARPPNTEGRGAITIRDLVKNSLRMRPDRIVVGECRGGETLDMLQAMNTGHDGSLTTLHANSPRDALSRMEVLVLMAGMDLPITAIREQIASAVAFIIQLTRFACGSRKITAVTEIAGVESGTIQLQDIFRYQQDGIDENGKVTGRFLKTGFLPTFLTDLEKAGFSVDKSIFVDEDEAFTAT